MGSCLLGAQMLVSVGRHILSEEKQTVGNTVSTTNGLTIPIPFVGFHVLENRIAKSSHFHSCFST